MPSRSSTLALAFVTLVSSLAIISCRSIAPEHIVTDRDYHLFSIAQQKEISFADVATAAGSSDVIIFGEEHDDAVGHYCERALLDALYTAFGANVALSMEMFERDGQLVLDEFLHGTIREKDFLKDTHGWQNYKDYRPLVNFAKEKKLDVIAANAPGRYASIAGRKGMAALDSLSPDAKKFVAPLPIDTATGEYYKKLNDTTFHPTAPGMPQFSMVYGQSVWDATMAYSIATYRQAHPAKKILQVNGRFHSDERFGIVQQLKKYDPACRVLVISSGRDSSFNSPKYDSLKRNGDYILMTNPQVPPSFESR